MTAIAYQAIPMPEQRYPLGPWRRLHESDAPMKNPDDLLTLAQNVWLQDRNGLPIVRQRPCLTAMGDAMGGAGQAIGQLTTIAGTEFTVAVVAGEIYTYDWGGDAWTKVVSTANLTTASSALNSSGNVYLTPFANELVITDGTNVAISWDGTSGAGGITELTNAPVFYGPVWVYYNQLFGIKNTARNTLVWSEVGDATTGYEAGGYANAWDLRQTSNDSLVALGATNSMLAVIRRGSATAITGEVTDNFASSGTTEAIDETTGTRSPGGTLTHGGSVYLYTDDSRIVRTSGGDYEDVGAGIRSSLSSQNEAELDNVRGVVWDAGQDGERLLIGYPEVGYTNRMTAFVCINPATGQAEGVWRGFHASAIGVVKDANGDKRVAILSGANATSITNGYAYVLGQANDTTGQDGFSDAVAGIQSIVRLAHTGADVALEKAWTRFDVSSVSPSGMTNVALSYATPYGARVVGELDFDAASGVFWDQFDWDEADWAGDAAQRKESARLKGHGRWCSVQLAHSTAGEVFAIDAAALRATLLDERTGVP